MRDTAFVDETVDVIRCPCLAANCVEREAEAGNRAQGATKMLVMSRHPFVARARSAPMPPYHPRKADRTRKHQITRLP